MIVDKLVKVRAIASEEQLAEVQKAAGKDNHQMVMPNVQFKKNGDEIIGSASLNTIPLVVFWMDSHCKPQESIQAISQCEAIMAAKGLNNYFVTVHEDSNFRPVIDKLGYSFVYNTNIFYKDLTTS